VQDDMNKQPGLIGYLFGSTNLTKNNVINMYNCFANSGSGEQFFQSQHSRADACVELNISNCTLLHDSYNRKNIGLFAASIVCKVNINIENLKIRIISDNLKVGYFRELYGIGELKLNAKNLYVEFFGENITFNDAFYYYPPNIEKYQINCDSLIFNYNNLFGDYYGTDFSAFYFSWRTGKIGLIALDGRGSFQGKIDEDWLLNKGYQKGNL